MHDLDPKVVVHRLAIDAEAIPIKQALRRIG